MAAHGTVRSVVIGGGYTGTAVIGLEAGTDHRIRSVLTADGSIPSDVVLLGLGVRPNTAFAREAGLPQGDHGDLRTNVRDESSGPGPCSGPTATAWRS